MRCCRWKIKNGSLSHEPVMLNVAMIQMVMGAPTNCEKSDSAWGQSAAMANKKKQSCWRYPLEYFLIIKRSPRYRTYLMSHLCQHVGDWFIRIASLLSVQRLSSGSAKALAGLVVAKVIPQVIMSPIGGTLADTFDRRRMMLALDTIGAFVTLGFILAIAMDNLSLFFVFTSLRATVHALYEPSTKAIVPMLVNEGEDLKRAVTMNGVAWSLMTVVGGLVAGTFSAYLGLEICYRKSYTLVDAIKACALICLHCSLGQCNIHHQRTSHWVLEG